MVDFDFSRFKEKAQRAYTGEKYWLQNTPCESNIRRNTKARNEVFSFTLFVPDELLRLPIEKNIFSSKQW